MKSSLKIVLLIIVATTVACSFSSTKKTDTSDEKKSAEIKKYDGIYANEFGEIQLTGISDTSIRTIFKNNSGDLFDTVMAVDFNFNLLPHDTFPFLRLNKGGIKVYENRIQVFEFSSMLYIDQFINIEKMYDRPFYKLNDAVVLEGGIRGSKGGETIEGIYLLNESKNSGQYVEIKGIIKKEKFPRSYYSTADGPQGMFGDTTVDHFRLVMEPISTKKIPSYQYTGTAMNSSSNNACIVWEFADSEAYILEGKEPWSEEELGMEITIDGVLIQNENGSVLKNWQILP